MALTRKLLKGLGLSEEQMDSIIDAHTDTVDALKAQVTDLTEKLTGLENAKTELSEGYKAKYEAVKKDFDNLKAEIATKETAAKLTAAYRERLEAAGIDPRRYDAILRVTDLSGLKLDADGKLENAASVDKAIAKEWSEFKVSKTVKGPTTPTPPEGGKAQLTKAEILAIKDTGARQQAIAENIELFTH